MPSRAHDANRATKIPGGLTVGSAVAQPYGVVPPWSCSAPRRCRGAGAVGALPGASNDAGGDVGGEQAFGSAREVGYREERPPDGGVGRGGEMDALQVAVDGADLQ